MQIRSLQLHAIENLWVTILRSRLAEHRYNLSNPIHTNRRLGNIGKGRSCSEGSQGLYRPHICLEGSERNCCSSYGSHQGSRFSVGEHRTCQQISRGRPELKSSSWRNQHLLDWLPCYDGPHQEFC